MSHLYHHGIKGMKWGVRRYQNPDGSLTTQGKLRYKQNADGSYSKMSRSERKAARKVYNESEIKRYMSGEDVRGKNRLVARSRMHDTGIEFENEHDRTEEGARLRSEYDRANSDFKNAYSQYYYARTNGSRIGAIAVSSLLKPTVNNARDRVNKAGIELAKSRGRYVSERMINEYGERGLDHFLDDTMGVTARRAGESVVDRYVRAETDNLTYYGPYWDSI